MSPEAHVEKIEGVVRIKQHKAIGHLKETTAVLFSDQGGEKRIVYSEDVPRDAVIEKGSTIIYSRILSTNGDRKIIRPNPGEELEVIPHVPFIKGKEE